jgi:hypothetical protein
LGSVGPLLVPSAYEDENGGYHADDGEGFRRITEDLYRRTP